MLVKGIVDEDFVNYKTPSMFIICNSCSFKCDKLAGEQVCQNGALASKEDIFIDTNDIIARYIKNNITESIVFGGLEPLEQFRDVYDFVKKLRTEYNCNDTVVIYTGFNKNEILYQVGVLKQFKNIVMKYGRFLIGHEKHFDDVLGVMLASPNQYAEEIS